jgi:hypothetical protein
MSFTVGGSTPQLTFADATVQNTAALPLTGGSVSADITVNGLTVGRGAGAVSSNTAVGASALAGNTTGTNTTSIGYQANNSGNQTGSVAIGSQALYTGGGSQDVAVGYQAGYNAISSSGDAVYVGWKAGYSNTSGAFNVAIGQQALYSNTTASNNTAVGYQAGYGNTVGTSNTFLGYQAGYTNASGSANTFIGYSAGGTSAVVSATAGNTCIGAVTGYGLTTGTYNTFVGFGASVGGVGAGYYVTTGYKNTIIGGYNGNQGGLDIRTASNNVVLSDGDGNVAGRWANGGGWYQLNNSASWSTTSDARIKEKVKTIVNGLDVVMALRPVEFDYKISQQHTAGFIAQEYETVLPDQIIEDANISDELKALTNGEPVKGIQQNLVPYLVSAIQALKAEFDAYKVSHP